jgi:hypothetical protein
VVAGDGARQAHELHRWMFGYERLDIARQLMLRDSVLGAFSASMKTGPGAERGDR